MPLWCLALRRLWGDRAARLGLVLVAALFLFALVGPLLVGDPNASDFALERGPRGELPGPSARHLFGTDPLFRDLLARLAAGARLSLAIAAGATLLALGVGGAIGLCAGYLAGGRAGRWVDGALMRVCDVALAFPYLLLVTAVGVAIDRADAVSVIAILGLTGWTGVARLTRAKTIDLARSDWALAARALGAGHGRIIVRHLLPGLAPSLLIVGSHALAQMILAEAVLGYLTVGVEPPQATWGRMLFESERYLGAQPLIVAAPAFAILVAVLGFTRVGDGLRDALEPRRGVRASGTRAVDLLILAGALAAAALATPDAVPAPIAHAAPASAPQRGGVLRLAVSQQLRSLEPALAYDEAASNVFDLMLARLVHYDARGELAGELCERFEVDASGTRYRFVLREGLRFHDGAPLGALDVKRSLERTLHPETPCPAASLYQAIAGYDDYQSGKASALAGVVVRDARTVEIALREPSATFLSALTLAFAAPVCPSSPAPTRATTLPCGAGPFRADAWVKGERIELARFDGWVDRDTPGAPYLDGIVVSLGVPVRTQRYRFERGELDLVHELAGVDVGRYLADPAWAEHGFWVNEPATHGIFLDTSRPPFDQRHLRRAIALAIDGSVLSRVQPSVVEVSQIVPAALPGSPRAGWRRHDLALALREMDLAGHGFDPASGRGGYPETIDFLVTAGGFEQSAAEIYQQQLARVGLRIRLRLESWPTYLAEVSTRGRAVMGFSGWHADYPDPLNFFETLLTTGAIRDEGSQNVSFFSNAELDHLVEAARSERDPDRRRSLFERAEAIAAAEAPWVPIYTNRSYHLRQPYVRGYEPHPVVPLRLRHVWIDRARGGR